MQLYFELDENDYKIIYAKGGRIEHFLFEFNKVQKTGTFEHSFRKHLNSVYTFI